MWRKEGISQNIGFSGKSKNIGFIEDQKNIYQHILIGKSESSDCYIEKTSFNACAFC